MPSFGEVCFTFVEMRKWMELGTFDVESSRDAWMLFFTQPEKVMEVYTPEQRKRYNEMIEAVEAWDKTKYTEHELWAMERTVQAMWANESYLKMAWKEGREEGRATGRAEGLLEGREEGREEGRHEGRAEGRAEGLLEGRHEGRAEGRHEGRQEGQKEGYEQGVSTLFAAWQYLKANPGVSDEQLSARFHLPSEALAAVRAMAGGSDI